MAIQHANPRATLSPEPSRMSLPHPQRLSPGRRRPSQQLSPRDRFDNSTHHVFKCSPLSSPRRRFFGLSSPRRRFFGLRPFDAYIFGTFHGAIALGDFQRATNRLLRPLPPDQTRLDW